MNPQLDFIFSRRSIRKYENKAVPRTMIRDLLEAAMSAPSAVKKDPWHIIVVQSRETLDRIVEIMPNAQMLKQAPACFIVCGDIQLVHEQKESYMLQELSAAVENTLLAARALGLGTCWLGIHPRQDRIDGIRQMFQFPQNIIPMCGIAIGWPSEDPGARTRFNGERVHMDVW